MLTKLERKYGDIVNFSMGGVNIFLVSNPAYIRDVLVTREDHFIKSRGLQATKVLLGNGLLTSEGEFHRRQRRLIQPGFQHEKMTAYADVMVEYADRQVKGWREGEVLDMHGEMTRLTLAIVAKALFNADVELEAKEIGKALTTSL